MDAIFELKFVKYSGNNARFKIVETLKLNAIILFFHKNI